MATLPCTLALTLSAVFLLGGVCARLRRSHGMSTWQLGWLLSYAILGAVIYHHIHMVYRREYFSSWRVLTLGVLALHVLLICAWEVGGGGAGNTAPQALCTLGAAFAAALALQAMLINHEMALVALLAPYLAWLLLAGVLPLSVRVHSIQSRGG